MSWAKYYWTSRCTCLQPEISMYDGHFPPLCKACGGYIIHTREREEYWQEEARKQRLKREITEWFWATLTVILFGILMFLVWAVRGG